MHALMLLVALLLSSPAPGASGTPLSCYEGAWEMDEEHTFSAENLDAFGGAPMPIRFERATGRAVITFHEGGFTYTFTDWTVSFRGDGEGLPPLETRMRLVGTVWGRYESTGGDGLAIFLSGPGLPAPDLNSTVTLVMQGMEHSDEMSFGSLFGPQTFLLTYRCIDGALYADGESAGGMFSNARFTRAR